MGEGLVVSIRDSKGPMDTPWGSELRMIEERVKKTEEDGIRARWESGKKLLARREGKKLPKGLLDEVAKEVGVSRSELKHRTKFAEKFSTEKELDTVRVQFRTWDRVKREALPEKRQPRPKNKPSRYGLLLRQWRKELRTMQMSDLSEPDLKVLDEIQEEIARLYDSRAETSRG